MPHEHYSLLLKQAEALVNSESDFIANTANLASLLFNNLENVNWAGFYLFRDNELVLGPFNGQVACTRIPIGKGVCGTAFETQETLVVEDVHAFAGHIACDAASESEVVVPFSTRDFRGVLDIDSPVVNRFGNAEKALFEGIVELIELRHK